MKWASALSRERELAAAVESACAELREQLGDGGVDLAVVFPSFHYGEDLAQVPDLVRRALGGAVVIGCSGGGVIGAGREVEGELAFSITAAQLPQVVVAPFRLEAAQVPDEGAKAGSWERALRIPAEPSLHFLLFPDPFGFPSEQLLRGLDRDYPESVKIGGLASGGRGPGQNALFLGGETHRSGIVGVGLAGNVQVDTIVAQGCRPIGEPMFVTRCQGNQVLHLDGQPPRTVLREMYQLLDQRDRELLLQSLFLGIVMKEAQSEYRQGDFLIRNILGVDPENGSMAVGTTLRENQVVQFHLRDARTSAEDLQELLGGYREARREGGEPAGSLMFSCLGRGMHLYGRPDHDTDLFRRHMGELPLGGFFCNGEIGPVQGRTFLHGYTSSLGIFRSR